MTPPNTEYCEIHLSQNQVTRLTLEHFLLYGHLHWYAKWSPLNRAYYAVCHMRDAAGKYPVVYLHRLILGLTVGDKRKGDHINHDTLNNIHTDDPLTNNLRIVSHAQNMRNTRTHHNHRSGYKGVSFSKERGKWRARIMVDGRVIFLGYFKTAVEAHEAYRSAAEKHFGEYAFSG